MHEKCLRIVYYNNTATYEEFLETDNSVSVHFQNVQTLAIELYKVVSGFSPGIMKDVFPLNENLCYSTENKRTFHTRDIRVVHFGSETLSYLSLPMKMRLKNRNRQIDLTAYAEHIYFRFALCNYLIIQNEAFFRLSFINIFGIINICTPANIWCGWGLFLA